MWTATITPNTGVTGNVLVDLAKDAVRDRAGNGNAAATQLEVPVDTGAATVLSIERHDGTSAQAEHTNANSLTFRVTFSEAVSNVNAADFDASGTTGDATGVADVTGNAAQYIVTVSSGDLDDYDGVVGLTLASDHDIADKAGNALTATTLTGANQSYTVDNTAPTVRLARADGAGTTLAGAFDVTVTFTEANGLQTAGAGAFTAADLTVTAGSATALHGHDGPAGVDGHHYAEHGRHGQRAGGLGQGRRARPRRQRQRCGHAAGGAGGHRRGRRCSRSSATTDERAGRAHQRRLAHLPGDLQRGHVKRERGGLRPYRHHGDGDRRDRQWRGLRRPP